MADSIVCGIVIQRRQQDFPYRIYSGLTTPEKHPTGLPDGVVGYSLNIMLHDNNLGLSITGRIEVFGFNDGFNTMRAQTEIQYVPEGPNVRATTGQVMRSVQADGFRLTETFLPPGNE